MGVPYCRFQRQIVTEKRSQIQSVSRNPNECDETREMLELVFVLVFVLVLVFLFVFVIYNLKLVSES